MRDTFFSRYERQLQTIDDKYNLDLDFRNYEAIAERDIRFRDLPTTASAISAAGLALVIDGCKDLSKVNSIHKIAVGRGLDLFDGNVARFLDQSSDMGALVDACCDKLGMAAIARAAWQQDALPKSYIGYVGAKNFAHAAFAVVTAINHPTETYRPHKSGKYAMFGDNIGGGLLLYAHAYEQEFPEMGQHTRLRAAGTAAALTSVLPEVVAARQYYRWAKKSDD